MSSVWKVPANAFSMFSSNKQKPYYGKALEGSTNKVTSLKQAVEADEVVEDSKGNIEVQNATSWDKDTHPNGAGPSKLVNDIDYNRDTKDLTVKYRDGFVAVYHNIEPGDAWTFATSASKGRWAHEHLWDQPYD